MRGFFIGLAAAPMVLMDGDGAAGEGSDRDRNKRGIASSKGPANNAMSNIGGRSAEDGIGEPARGGGAPGPGAVDPALSPTGETPRAVPSREPGNNQLRPADENRPGPQSGPVRGAPVDERLRRAVVVLGIPGSLAARANTLF